MIDVEVRWIVEEGTLSKVWRLPRIPVVGDLLLIEESKTWLRAYQVMIAPRIAVLAVAVLDWEYLRTRLGMEVEVETT